MKENDLTFYLVTLYESCVI